MSHSQYNHHGVKPTGIEEVWGDLRQGMDDVYQHQGMSRPKYIALYSYPFISSNVKFILCLQ